VISVVFYELPRGEYWDGLARLAFHILQRGKSVILVNNLEEASSMSRSLWNMSHGELVPHGTVGVDEDEDLDPVVIAVAPYAGPRKILILSSPNDVEHLSPGTLVVEPVPQDARRKQTSRARYRRYRERGVHLEFIPYDEWSGA
jgi:DNA polymerase IIIc chi subunit